MAYDVDEAVLVQTISASDLPDDAKEIINDLLTNGEDTQVETLEAGGAVSAETDFAEITGTGTYTAAGTPVVVINTDDDVQLTYTVGGSVFTITAGQGDDVIVMQDGVQLASGGTGGSTSTAGGVVNSGAGNDSVSGASGNDTITGGEGNDTISGGAGNDIIAGNSGADSVSGGTGFDVATQDGGISSYTVTVDEAGNIVLTDGAGEVDTLSGVEYVSFSDGTAVAAVENQEQGTVARLYEAIFDRVADAAGLNYWIETLNQGGGTTEDIAGAFLDAEGGKAALSNEAFVEALYGQFLNRAADDEGKAFWVGALDAGVSKEAVTVGFAASTEAEVTYDYVKIVGSSADFDFS
ncbi:MAG: DUF4214 domain-containing protein [Pseudomonadota bacterium]